MNHILLAVETAEAVEAGSSLPGGLIVGLLVGALALFGIAYKVVGPGRDTTASTASKDVPLAMRPYHSDEELETTGLERAMSWGVALSLFVAVFIPLYWVIEPTRIDDRVDELYEEDVALGRSLYAANCSSCHGTNAEGGVASHPDPNVTAAWPAPALDNIATRYAGSNVVNDIEYFINQTLYQGRPGTPMPAWGSAFAGPMNDQQIESITTYLLSIQTGELEEPNAEAFVGQSGEDIYVNNCARCHGYEIEDGSIANGRVGPNLRIIYDQFGADLDDPTSDSYREARESLQYILESGLYVPTGAIMPSYENVLTDEAEADLLDFIESIQVPTDSLPYPAEVGQQGLITAPND